MIDSSSKINSGSQSLCAVKRTLKDIQELENKVRDTWIIYGNKDAQVVLVQLN